MTTQQVADRLVALCREGNYLQAIDELYASDILSVEAMGSPDMPAERRGFDVVRGKSEWWLDNHILHGGEVSEPIVGPSHFAVKLKHDSTFKPNNQRMTFEELAVYEVKNGKIVREQFFYATS